ncbi:LmrA/YxaF family transcription factor [Streptosporangium roseum]|uniref:LmrA/YxaF family transcription factor n=1 Tax=Streptosporangium roseum TaxID=2001 RepID=UPI003316AA3A
MTNSMKIDRGGPAAAKPGKRERLVAAHLDQLPSPQERLKALLGGWTEQRELAARYGCPFGTLSSELGKRADGLDHATAAVMRLLVDRVEQQFRTMGRDDSHDLAITLVATYQGISLLTTTFRDPELMTSQIHRLDE